MNVILAAVGALSVSSAALADVGPEDAAAFAQAVIALDGAWTGALTYRDFQTDERVSIPHDRRIEASPDGGYVIAHLAFTDPGYRVYNAEIAAFDGAEIDLAYAGRGGIEASQVTLETFESGADGWRAELIGDTMDNGARADALYTWVLVGDRLEITKAVRTDGQTEYRFRNGVTLDRVAAAR